MKKKYLNIIGDPKDLEFLKMTEFTDKITDEILIQDYSGFFFKTNFGPLLEWLFATCKNLRSMKIEQSYNDNII